MSHYQPIILKGVAVEFNQEYWNDSWPPTAKTKLCKHQFKPGGCTKSVQDCPWLHVTECRKCKTTQQENQKEEKKQQQIEEEPINQKYLLKQLQAQIDSLKIELDQLNNTLTTYKQLTLSLQEKIQSINFNPPNNPIYTSEDTTYSEKIGLSSKISKWGDM